MPVVTITIEETPAGGIFIRCDPTILAIAGKPDHLLSQADGYAMVAWTALMGAARQAAEEQGRTFDAGELPDRPH